MKLGGVLDDGAVAAAPSTAADRAPYSPSRALAVSSRQGGRSMLALCVYNEYEDGCQQTCSRGVPCAIRRPRHSMPNVGYHARE